MTPKLPLGSFFQTLELFNAHRVSSVSIKTTTNLDLTKPGLSLLHFDVFDSSEINKKMALHIASGYCLTLSQMV